MDRRKLQLLVLEKLNATFEKKESERLARYLLEDLKVNSKEIGEDLIAIVMSATERLVAGEPLQYVTNKAHFYGYEFYVDAAVLSPRAETEELVYQVLQYLKKTSKTNASILDIGTGSGCIPITIKKENENCDLAAYDISKNALKVAIQNANALGVSITFEDCNILSKYVTKPKKPFDIIISNPPYIPISEQNKMGDSVINYEPHVALFTDDEYGLVFYKRIADLCSSWLANDGAVFLELNEFHARKIKEIYQQEGSFSRVEIIKDMQGKERILMALR